MAEIIGYANPDNEKYFTIQLATKKGVRKTRVRKKGFKKRYGKLRRKEEVYAKKTKVYNRLTGRVSTRTNIDRKDYIYNPEVKAYEKYDADRRINIKTQDGPRNVSQEQLRYLYKRRGGTYVRTKDVERLVSKQARYEPRRGRLQKSMQVAITRKVTIEGNEYTVTGYSKVQRGEYEIEEMREQAQRHLKAVIMDSGGKYDYSNVEFTSDEEENYVKWVYGNGNY